MKQQDGRDKRSTAYYHGNLREALVQAALTMIAEQGVPKFAIAELAQRGLGGLEAELALAAKVVTGNPIAAVEGCAQAHLAYAGRRAAVYAAMFDQQLAPSVHPELLAAATQRSWFSGG